VEHALFDAVRSGNSRTVEDSSGIFDYYLM
jgi:hypothetical protein